MVFGRKKDDEWNVNGLEGDERVLDLFTSEQIIRRPTLDHSWPFYNVPFKVPKNWKKDNDEWKKINGYFYALTNKRWLVVDYDSKNIIRSFHLSECSFLVGASQTVTVAGHYKKMGGGITIMRGTQRVWGTSTIFDHLKVHQTILHLQGVLGNSSQTNQEMVNVSQSKGNSSQSLSPTTANNDEEALKILKMRFVNKEISKEEFEEMKRML